MQGLGMFLVNPKVRAASLSVASNTILTLGKLGTGLHMNSVSVISEAVHSGLDLVAALIAFFSVRQSSKPADERHLYGHGKFENIAGIVEALLILIAAVLIVAGALPKLSGHFEIQSLDLGAAVMGISAAVNVFVSARLMKVARETESPALEADAWHLRTDVYTSLGVFAGILAIKITGLYVLDPLIALGVAVLIIKAAVGLIADSMRSLLDVRLPEGEEKVIKQVLEEYAGEYVEFHNLRTRRAGSQRYIDLHLVVPRQWPVNRVHELCERIEEEVGRELKGAQLLIHTEPCGEQYCKDCVVERAADREKACAFECDLCCPARKGPEK